MVNFNATLIAQVLNFLILVLVLSAIAYKPLLKVMDERKAKIAGDLNAAEKAKEDAEAVKAEYAEKLAEAKAEAQAIIDEARKAAAADHDKVMAEVKAEQEQIIATAKQSIAADQEKAMEDVRAQVINLSIAVASKIVEQKLGSEEDKKLAGKIADSLMK